MLNSDLDEQLTLLGIEYIKGIFERREFRADPHPGNVKLLDNNRVGLIDFGIFDPLRKINFLFRSYAGIRQAI